MKRRSLWKIIVISYLPVFSLFLMSYIIMVESGKKLQDVLSQVISVTSIANR